MCIRIFHDCKDYKPVLNILGDYPAIPSYVFAQKCGRHFGSNAQSMICILYKHTQLDNYVIIVYIYIGDTTNAEDTDNGSNKGKYMTDNINNDILLIR